MAGIYGWMKSFLIFFLLISIIIQLVADESYQKYIKQIAGVIFLILFLSPLLNLTGNNEKFHSFIESESLWAEYRNEKADAESVLTKEGDKYLRGMEGSFEESIKNNLEENELKVLNVKVVFNEEYEIGFVQIRIQDEGKDAEIQKETILNCLKQEYGVEGELIEIQVW